MIGTGGELAEIAQASATKAISVASDGSLTEIAATGTQKVLSLAGDGSLQETSVTFGSAWSPSNLTSLAAWYDPSDFTTMWQDSAKTTPVTGANQPIGYMADKSGNGRHALQATSGTRPTLKQDGNGYYYVDCAGTVFLDMTATSASMFNNIGVLDVSVAVGGYPGTTWQPLLLSRVSGSTYLWVGSINSSSGTGLGGRRLTSDGWQQVELASIPATPSVLIHEINYAGAMGYIYVNGSLSQSGSFQTAGNTANYSPTMVTLYGAGNGAGYGGKIYGVVMSYGLSAGERASIDTYLGAKCGLTI
jgi:hypothetical protein